MTELVEHAVSAMGTVVSIQLVGTGGASLLDRAKDAMRWVGEVERTCSRFAPSSELSQLTTQHGRPVAVSPMLAQLLMLARATASISNGAFDPTVGSAPRARWQDIEVDEARGTVVLRQPMRLDLGAIAKGFAVDLIARALADLPSVAINAGGDLYCRGRNLRDEMWSVGIRDPFASGGLLLQLSVDGLAVCTSGSYERQRPDGGHHLIDPLHGTSSRGLVSCTVVCEGAAVADALATAAFVLGAEKGALFLADQQVDALLVDEEGRWHAVHAGARIRFPDQGSPLPSA